MDNFQEFWENNIKKDHNKNENTRRGKHEMHQDFIDHENEIKETITFASPKFFKWHTEKGTDEKYIQYEINDGDPNGLFIIIAKINDRFIFRSESRKNNKDNDEKDTKKEVTK